MGQVGNEPASHAVHILKLFLIKDMKKLELFLGLIGIPFLVILFCLPESPRWLYVNGFSREAEDVVKTFCLRNNRACTAEQLTELAKWGQEQKLKTIQETANLSSLASYPAVRRNLLIMNFCWFSISMTYFGLVYNLPSFGLNEMVAFALPNLILIPGLIIIPILENSYGCKIFLFLSLILCGLFLMLTQVIPHDYFTYNWPILALAYLGIFCCGIAFYVANSYTRELFPTSIRTSCLSAASSFARVGAMLSPVVAIIGQGSPLLPVFIFGSFSLLAGIASIWIWPETKGLDLPDSLNDCEKASRKENQWILRITSRFQGLNNVMVWIPKA